MAARERMRRAGPRATGRPAASRARWAEIKEEVIARAGGCCEACGARTRLDIHHVLKRAQGGSDVDRDGLVALCRRCHEQTDTAYASGRLVVTPLGGGRFRFELAKREADRDQEISTVPTPFEAMRMALGISSEPGPAELKHSADFCPRGQPAIEC